MRPTRWPSRYRRRERYAVAAAVERPLRVVLDANVWVSALIATGGPHRIVTAWMHDARVFEVVLCPALIGEVRDVLSRPKITRLVADGLAEAFLDDVLRAAGDLYPDPAAGDALTRDADDDYLIALAREAGADAIVTGDRDLLDWPEQIPPVMTPAAFETRLSSR